MGSRLKSRTPKVLFPVNERPMIDYLFDLYASFVECFVLVLHPSFAEEVRRHCAKHKLRIEYLVQSSPTGMLDAIMVPQALVRRLMPASVWITWCDQIAIRAQTAAKLAELSEQHAKAAMVFPTISRTRPYIHLVRNETNRIIEVLHQREGDELPAVGESDMGLFSLEQHAYLDSLAEFSQNSVTATLTRERNFLPFIPWIQRRAEVKTFPGGDIMESMGINTMDDLNLVAQYLRNGDQSSLRHHSRL
jgi:bifunctional N-acetylglucosamine-1-phosphate-uridyltransferase/glucosamine-1-phosphate-acetyltransferase GlmU-like protein